MLKGFGVVRMNLGMAQDRASADRNIGEIIKGLGTEPAYLLVFALFLLVGIGSFASGLSALLATVITLGSFLLAAFAIYLVERRKGMSVTAGSPAQHARLEGLRDEDTAIRGIFGPIVSEASDTYFVYSSTPVSGYQDYSGKPIEYPFGSDELLVTAVPDALGIAKIHSLLHLAGKHNRLSIVTARTFPADAWEKELILIGSKNSNPDTEIALTEYNAPYRFSEDVRSIVEAAPGGAVWPASPDELRVTDYGLLVKLRVRRSESDESTYLILAGIGAPGTLAVCHFLQRNIAKLYERFGDAPFGCVLSVDRSQSYTSVELVASTPVAIYSAP
jgi:hypothetical protein